MNDSTLFISNRELENLDYNQKIAYYERLKYYCNNIKKPNHNKIHNIVGSIYPSMLNFNYEFEGEENIPDDGKCLFICNHSNAHDFFTSHCVGKHLGTNISVFAASDDLNAMSNLLFKKCNATLIDRRDKTSSQNGILEMCSYINNGIPGVIFGEGTWNLHPYKPMQDMKIGGSMIAAISDVVVIPTIYEYVEVPRICDKEKELYSKCIIKFGKPIKIDRSKSLIEQTNNIQSTLEKERKKIWKDLNIEKNSLEDIDKYIYLNHTYLKKFDVLGFTYDSESEAKFLFSKDKKPVENEFKLNETGKLVPGVTKKEEKSKQLIYTK